MSPHVSETLLTNTKFNENLLSDFSDGWGRHSEVLYNLSIYYGPSNTTLYYQGCLIHVSALKGIFKENKMLRLFTRFVDLAVRVYQIYSLKMTLEGLKHVGVTCSVDKVVI